MARYILIDNISGYIFGDSADLNGEIFNGTPEEFAAALDKSIGVCGRTYEMLSRDPQDSSTGYRVYRADVNGSDAVTVVHDGQDQETINAVEEHCEFAGFILCKEPVDYHFIDEADYGSGQGGVLNRIMDATGHAVRPIMVSGTPFAD